MSTDISPTPAAAAEPRAKRVVRGQRTALIGVLGFVVIVALLHLVGGWLLASDLDSRALSAEARRASLAPDYTIEVLGVGPNSITLYKPGNARLERDGTYGLFWDGGIGTVGRILRHEDGAVVREFAYTGKDAPSVGALAALDGRVYAGDPLTGRGIPYEEVFYSGELGTYPAWFVPGTSAIWFIFMHGNAMTRADGLRILPTVVGTGMPALIPTYRGDDGAPESSSGRLSYGKEEWRDLEAAVRYALDHGAESVILEGISMGGAVVMAFLLESPLAAYVDGAILDSPVLDFKAAVEHQAGDERLPLLPLPVPITIVKSGEWIAQLRFGVDWNFTNYLARADELNTPLLIFHGTDDDTVPLRTSQALVRLRPDLVTDHAWVEGAGHAEPWNLDPGDYERRVLGFLTSIGALR